MSKTKLGSNNRRKLIQKIQRAYQNIRKWECKICGFIKDRDLNASINIMNKGIDMYIKEQYGN